MTDKPTEFNQKRFIVMEKQIKILQLQLQALSMERDLYATLYQDADSELQQYKLIGEEEKRNEEVAKKMDK
jgi:hypothetical protein